MRYQNSSTDSVLVDPTVFAIYWLEGRIAGGVYQVRSKLRVTKSIPIVRFPGFPGLVQNTLIASFARFKTLMTAFK